MTWPLVPVDNRSLDWPRKIAQAINYLLRNDLTDQFANLADFADDTAAAAGGVEVGKLYRTGSVVKVRIS